MTCGQCFFLGKCLIGPIEVDYFGMGYSRRKNPIGSGRLRTYFFLKETWNCFDFSLYLLKISGKTKLHPWKFGKIMYVESLGNFKAKKKNFIKLHPWKLGKIMYVTSLWNFKAKNQDLWKFLMNFSWSPLDIPHCF